MSIIDWLIVIAWVGGTSLVGLFYSRRVKTLDDYLLAGRKLAWWQICAAQTADSVDSSDFVSSSGLGYRTGMTGIGLVFSYMTFGFIALSRWVLPSLYRSGLYTNAEYLELRYTRGLRICSMIIQVMYRTVAISVMVYSTALMLQIVLNLQERYIAILAAMILTMGYTFLGGQISAVMASIPQVALMLFSAVVLFVVVWAEVGGFAGIEEGLQTSPDLLRFGGMVEPGVPTSIFLIGLTLTVAAYPLINQAVAQRALAARSLTHARIGTVGYLPFYWIFGSSIMFVGIAGLVLFPGMTSAESDSIYPRMMTAFLPVGLLGAGVAAMLVATMSTGAAMGTAVSAVITIDLYKRFLRPNEQERHYLRLARFSSLAVLIAGTLLAFQIPKMKSIVDYYIALTGTLFLPLAVPYLAIGLFPRASRRSGMTGFLVGSGLGLVLFILESSWAQSLDVQTPVWLTHRYWRPIWVMLAGWLGVIGQTLYDHRFGDKYAYKETIENLDGQRRWYHRPGLYEAIIVAVVIAVLIYGW